jgi:hypothetical protein
VSALTDKDLELIKRVTETLLEAALPSLLKIAAAFSGNRVEAVGSLFTSEPVALELIRKELWVSVATAVARAENCTDAEKPARWADTALLAFDQRFKQGDTP